MASPSEAQPAVWPPLTANERATLRHALGLDQANVAYRNRYVAGDGHFNAPILRALVRRGLMEIGSTLNGDRDRVYRVTAAGMAAVSATPPAGDV